MSHISHRSPVPPAAFGARPPKVGSRPFLSSCSTTSLPAANGTAAPTARGRSLRRLSLRSLSASGAHWPKASASLMGPPWRSTASCVFGHFGAFLSDFLPKEVELNLVLGLDRLSRAIDPLAHLFREGRIVSLAPIPISKVRPRNVFSGCAHLHEQRQTA